MTQTLAVECTPELAGFDTASVQFVSPRKAERRLEARLRIEEPAVLRVLSPVADLMPVTIVDMSQSGLRVRAPQPLLPGVAVHIRIRKWLVVMGEVRSSVKVGDDYYSGIHVESVTDCRSSWQRS